ncbi:MAG: HAD hydrolase-like protein [Schleiferiaceae bacterium]|nr:HAD hydrolase-like protein [Schleiferiaceae bacterium]
MKENYKILLRNVKTFIFDVDGVLTDGGVFMFPGQDPIRKFNSKDGFAMQYAMRMGYKIAIITGGKSQGVVERLKLFGIHDIYTSAHNKIEPYNDLLACYDLDPASILYMGDDLPDFEVMTRVGVATTPADGAPELKAIAHYVSPITGGNGCVRDVIEQTMRVQEKWALPEHWTW